MFLELREMLDFQIQILEFLVMKTLQPKKFRCCFQILKVIAGELEFSYPDST